MSDYKCTAQRFAADVADWHMEILRDDGVDRHIQFTFGDGAFRWFEIITWKGRLYIGGDCKTFVFARLPDMFEFFRAGFNPPYWQEKIEDGRERAEEFDVEAFKEKARSDFNSWLANQEEADSEDLSDEFEGELENVSAEHEAVSFHRDYRTGYERGAFAFDTWKTFPGNVFTFQYIWVCRAIAWAIERYDEERAK